MSNRKVSVQGKFFFGYGNERNYSLPYLCRPDILAELATTIEAPPHIVLLPIGPLTPSNHHPLDCRKRAPSLEPVFNQFLDLIQKKTSTRFIFIAPLEWFQFIRNCETDDLQLWPEMLQVVQKPIIPEWEVAVSNLQGVSVRQHGNEHDPVITTITNPPPALKANVANGGSCVSG